MAKKLTAFQRQFAAARAAGAKDFSFGGKSYSTRRKDDAPKPGLRGLPGMFGRGTGPKVTKTTTVAANVPIPQPRPVTSGLPATSTAVPTSATGARINRIAANAPPPPADPAVMAKVNQSIARGRADPQSEFVAAGVHRGTRGAPPPQGSQAAQMAANRAKSRINTPAEARLTAPGLYVKKRIPPKVVKTTTVAAQKGDRLGKSTFVASNDVNQHDYSRLKFFK